MERKNAVIVAYGRSAIAKAIKGSLRYTGCVDFGSQVLKGILQKNPGFDPEWTEDLICGCAIPEAEQGLNIGRLRADGQPFLLFRAAVYRKRSKCHYGRAGKMHRGRRP